MGYFLLVAVPILLGNHQATTTGARQARLWCLGLNFGNGVLTRFTLRLAQISEGPRGRMINSIEIENFRLFKSVRAAGFRRINLILGDNAAGKTTLLEAMFLALAGNPEVAQRLRQWRGMEVGPCSPQEVYDGLFRGLFNNFDKDQVVQVSLGGTLDDVRQLKFFYDKGQPALLPLSEDGATASIVAHVPITFEWSDAAGRSWKAQPQLHHNAIAFPTTSPRKVDATFLASRLPELGSENARWFSDLSKAGDERRLVELVTAQFPEIEGLNVEVEMGVPALFVKFTNRQRKQPLSLVSDGLSKIISILIRIRYSQGTAVFVDELENGIHFSRHPRLWSQLLESCRAYSTQLFATTHSLEFLRSVLPTLSDNTEDFAVVRAYKENGTGKLAVVSGSAALSLIDTDFELRQ